ncbi:MAG: HEAT repeat domain-containing protein [Armatimonadota bacterium]
MAIKILQIPENKRFVILNNEGRAKYISFNNKETGKKISSLMINYFDGNDNGVLEQCEQVEFYKAFKPYLLDKELTLKDIEIVKTKLFAKRYGKGADEFKKNIEIASDIYESKASRQDAIRELSDCGQAAAPALPAFIKIIRRDQNGDLTDSVLEAVAKMGATSKELVWNMLYLLVKIEKAANLNPSRATSLSHNKIEEMLVHLSPQSIDHLGSILLNDRDPYMRRLAADSLSDMPSKYAGKTGAFLITALDKDKNGMVRAEAASSLGGLKLKQAKPYLLKSLNDKDARVRGHVLNALRQTVIEDKDVVNALISSLKKEKHPDIYANIIHVLGETKSVKAIPYIKQALKSEDEHLLLKAVAASGCLGKTGRSLVPILKQIDKTTDNSDIKDCIKNALIKMGE